MAQQQQYIQYAPQQTGAYPGTTVYTYPGSQPIQVVMLQRGVLNTGPVQSTYNQDGARAAIVLGTIQLIIGFACICFQSAALSLETGLGSEYGAIYTSEFIGTGIWCGILFLVTGILGILSSKKNTSALIISFMVFNIISSLTIWILLSFAASNLTWVKSCKDKDGTMSLLMIRSEPCTNKLYSVWQAMDSLMVALAVIEFVMAVTSSAYCCKAVCSCCQSRAGTVLQQPASGVYLPTTITQQQVVEQQQMLQQQQLLPTQQWQSPMAGKPYPVQGQQVPGAAYASTAGHPQMAGGDMVTTMAYQHHQTASSALPPYHPAPSAPVADLSSSDVKAPFLPPDYNAALKL